MPYLNWTFTYYIKTNIGDNISEFIIILGVYRKLVCYKEYDLYAQGIYTDISHSIN